MPPTSTPDTTELWRSDDPVVWRAAFDSYESRLKSLNHKELVSLDKWFRVTLPAAVSARTPTPHMLAAEFVQLVTWKITRGKRRNTLLGYARAHTDATMTSATSEALSKLKIFDEFVQGGTSLDFGTSKATADTYLLDSLKPLVALHGTGAATAAAVLAAVSPQVPMMSDELLAVVTWSGVNPDTDKNFLSLVTAVQTKAKRVRMTPREVERAVYAEACKTKPRKADSVPGKRKR